MSKLIRASAPQQTILYNISLYRIALELWHTLSSNHICREQSQKPHLSRAKAARRRCGTHSIVRADHPTFAKRRRMWATRFLNFRASDSSLCLPLRGRFVLPAWALGFAGGGLQDALFEDIEGDVGLLFGDDERRAEAQG